MTTRPIPSVTRFTSRYDTVEDRIKLLLELSDGKVQVLWLTRRLLNRMLVHLIKILDQATQAVASADAAPAQEVSKRPQTEALQRFSQEAAVSTIERQPEVGAGGEKPAGNLSYVVTSVDVHAGQKKLGLDFKSGENVLQSVPFEENSLRQWINIIHSQYRVGEWHETFWPSWIVTGSTGTPAKDDLKLN